MKRRNLLKTLLIGTVGVPFLAKGDSTAQRAQTKKLLQNSPVAGFQYHQGEQAWSKFKTGDEVLLIAEPSNKYDVDAVEIYWQEPLTQQRVKLGYLPRKQNYAVSQLLANGQNIHAQIKQLEISEDPWERISLAIYLEG